MPVIIGPLLGGATGEASKLLTQPFNLDIATSETFPYKVDFTNYTSAGDTPTLVQIVLYLISTGQQVPNNNWLGNVSINGNIFKAILLGSGLSINQQYELQVTISFKPNVKILTFITEVEVVA